MDPASLQLSLVACSLVALEKGLLAADESFGTIGKRFKAINLDSTEESRRSYRELLFTTPGIEEFISGVILFDETIGQRSSDGTPFPELLIKRGIIPGIKVDKGTKPLAHFPGETITEGLDGLRERLKEYVELGARFAKWRVTFTIDNAIPSAYCVEANAEALVRYASLCQEAGLVPIIEPEVLMEGAHDLARCEEVTTYVLENIFNRLYMARVTTEELLLKTNMVLPGKSSSTPASSFKIAETTIRTLRRTVPSAVPGVVFLSGGQKPQEATANLNAMNRSGQVPWRLSFSFSRALHGPVLEMWKGRDENRQKAQQLFVHRARCASAAVRGQYNEQMEKEYSGG